MLLIYLVNALDYSSALPENNRYLPKKYVRGIFGVASRMRFIPVRDVLTSDEACDAIFRPQHERQLAHAKTMIRGKYYWPTVLGVEALGADSVSAPNQARNGKSSHRSRKRKGDESKPVIDHHSTDPDTLQHDVCDLDCGDTNPELVLDLMRIKLAQVRQKSHHRLFCPPGHVIQFAKRYSLRRYLPYGEIDKIPDSPELVWKCSCILTPETPWQEIESEDDFARYIQEIINARGIIYIDRARGDRPHTEYLNNPGSLLEAAKLVMLVDRVQVTQESTTEEISVVSRMMHFTQQAMADITMIAESDAVARAITESRTADTHGVSGEETSEAIPESFLQLLYESDEDSEALVERTYLDCPPHRHRTDDDTDADWGELTLFCDSLIEWPAEDKDIQITALVAQEDMLTTQFVNYTHGKKMKISPSYEPGSSSWMCRELTHWTESNAKDPI